MIELLLLFICHPFPDSIRSEPRQVRSARWHPQSMIDLLLEIAMETAKSTHRRMIADLNMSLGQAIPAPRLLHRLLSAKKIWIKKTIDRATMTAHLTTSGINRKIEHTTGLLIQGLQCHLWRTIMQQIICTYVGGLHLHVYQYCYPDPKHNYRFANLRCRVCHIHRDLTLGSNCLNILLSTLQEGLRQKYWSTFRATSAPVLWGIRKYSANRYEIVPLQAFNGHSPFRSTRLCPEGSGDCSTHHRAIQGVPRSV